MMELYSYGDNILWHLQLLESASKLLVRNEHVSFIAGASVFSDSHHDETITSAEASGKPSRRHSLGLASEWRSSGEGNNFSGHQQKRSEIRLKSQQSFASALHIGEFVELVR
jgi:hypothetical protein